LLRASFTSENFAARDTLCANFWSGKIHTAHRDPSTLAHPHTRTYTLLHGQQFCLLPLSADKSFACTRSSRTNTPAIAHIEKNTQKATKQNRRATHTKNAFNLRQQLELPLQQIGHSLLAYKSHCKRQIERCCCGLLSLPQSHAINMRTQNAFKGLCQIPAHPATDFERHTWTLRENCRSVGVFLGLGKLYSFMKDSVKISKSHINKMI